MRGQKAKAPFYHVLLCGVLQKVQPRVRVCLLTSNCPGKKILPRCAQLLGFYLILDVLGLTTKISPHELQMYSAIKVSETDSRSCEKFIKETFLDKIQLCNLTVFIWENVKI